VRTLPDAEAVLGRYLRGHEAVNALVGQRVSSALPDRPTWPYVRLVRIGGRPVVARHLDAANVQVEAWADTGGNGRALAWLVAATVHAVLHEAPEVAHVGAVITGVSDTLGFSWAPDDLTNRPRWLFAVTVYLHP
jgi:hypothetical protein